MNKAFWKKILFTLIILLIFFTGLEMLSRLLAPKQSDRPVVVERIMDQDVQHDWLESDPILFWKLAGSEPGKTVFRIEKPALERIDELCGSDEKQTTGFTGTHEQSDRIDETLVGLEKGKSNDHYDQEVRPEKNYQSKRLLASFEPYIIDHISLDLQAGMRRIVCLGDSCTFFGQPSYSAMLEILLNCQSPHKNVQVINAGVPAYSSLQGLRYLQNRLLEYHPDIVTVYFGWNDHWLARDGADIDHDLSRVSPFIERFLKKCRSLDLLRLFIKRIQRSTASTAKKTVRVSLEDYRSNLVEMAKTAEKQGFKLVYLTAPHGFDPDNLPNYLEEMGYVDDLSLLIDMHDDYNDVVRQVAAETGLVCVDLAALIDKRADRKNLFLSDGIHLSDSGIKVIAETIHQRLKEIR
ncbi:MAG: GDSL-type esterase/lipase family protein [bacterium]